MANLGIIKFGSEVLRKVAQPVDEINGEVKQIIRDMFDTLYTSNNGVGLAAPQVGISKRIIVIDLDPSDSSCKPIALINPEIVEKEGEAIAEEGCLSIPEVRGDVKRSAKVVVEGLNPEKQKLRIEATELLSRALQHEIDHLNGILFIDHLGKLKQQLIKKQLRKIKEGSKSDS